MAWAGSKAAGEVYCTAFLFCTWQLRPVENEEKVRPHTEDKDSLYRGLGCLTNV